MKKNLFLLLLAVVFLGACSLIPKYDRPNMPAPSAWPTGSAYEDATSDATPISEVPWREFFIDRELQQVIETALENNRDLRIAALNVQRARALYGIQRAELFPSLNATGGGSKTRLPADLSSDGEAAMTTEEYSANLGISAWEIDFFGRIRILKKRALQQYLASEEARRSAQVLIVSEVASTYLAMAANRANLKLAETTFETQKSAHHLISRRCEMGIATDLDRYRSEMQLENARRDIARYKQLVAQIENALTLLIGAAAPVSFETTMDLDRIDFLQDISAGVSSEALLKRPDIMQAELLLKAAYANIGAARAALFPRISLTTSFGTASSELSRLFDSGQDTWNFAPGAVLPIFDARLWSAITVTKAEREIALAQYEKAVQTAFREVADALAAKGTVMAQVAAQEALVNAAAETFRLSDTRYLKGIDSYLSVLDAQRSLYAAQQVLVALNLERLVSQVRLYAVLGGGSIIASGVF